MNAGVARIRSVIFEKMPMCFSATASLVAGGALGVTGGLTMMQTKTKSELPFASIPLLFGIQQAIEGVVWLSFGAPLLHTIATYAYMMFSHVLWPIFIPVSIILLETDRFRKKILWMFSLVGLAVGAYLAYYIITDVVTVQVVHQSLRYYSINAYPIPIIMFYLMATCGSCFFSSHRIINLFGLVLSLSFIIAVWFFFETFFSVWCFLAAILSVLVYWYFKREERNKKKRGLSFAKATE